MPFTIPEITPEYITRPFSNKKNFFKTVSEILHDKKDNDAELSLGY
jgi:hypothetical protein